MDMDGATREVLPRFDRERLNFVLAKAKYGAELRELISLLRHSSNNEKGSQNRECSNRIIKAADIGK